MSLKILRRTYLTLLACAVVLCVMWATMVLAVAGVYGRIEGRLWPVVTTATITHVEDVGGGWTRVSGYFDKLRDCDLSGLLWWQGPAYHSAFAPFRFDRAPQEVAPGRFVFSGIAVQLQPGRVASSSANVLHQCHHFWPTESAFIRG